MRINALYTLCLHSHSVRTVTTTSDELILYSTVLQKGEEKAGNKGGHCRNITSDIRDVGGSALTVSRLKPCGAGLKLSGQEVKVKELLYQHWD